MTKRIILSYIGMAVAILLLLEIPLGVLTGRHELDSVAGQAQREATGVAVAASEDIEHHRLPELSTLALQYQQRTGGELTVVDSSGNAIATSDRDDTDWSKESGLVKAAIAGHAVRAGSKDEGAPCVFAAVPLTSDEASTGAVLLEIPTASTEHRIHMIWLALAGFGFIILCATALIGWLMARSLVTPLARLEKTVSDLASGELQTRADINDGPPEVRSLATEFNTMAGRLTDLLQAQSRFVADASHQLRSPLTALRLRLENLEADISVPQAKDLAAAAREVQRLSRLVDGLLVLSRAESGQPQRVRTPLAEVLKQRCEAWGALAEEHQIRLLQRLESPAAASALVGGDLEQILDNLLANAVEASPTGSTIEVSLRSAGKRTWEISVKDQGYGMTEEELSRAFDRFWQAPGKQRGHSGLGLAIVKQLVSRNSGEVNLNQGDPNGLIATLRFPSC